MLSNSLMVFNRQGGGGKNWYDSSDVERMKTYNSFYIEPFDYEIYDTCGLFEEVAPTI